MAGLFDVAVRLGNSIKYHDFNLLKHLYSKAVPLLQRAMTIRDKLPEYEHIELANIFNTFGVFYCYLGHYDKAEPLLKQALAIGENLDVKQSVTMVSTCNLALLYQNQHRYVQAEHLYSQSLALCEQLGDRQNYAITLERLGSLAYHRRQINEALEWYHRALNAFDELGDWHGRAITLGQLGSLASYIGNYKEAEKWYHEALMAFDKSDDRRNYAVTLERLGSLASYQRSYSEARLWYLIALKAFEKLDDRQSYAITLEHLGSLSQEQMDINNAKQLYQRALEIFDLMDDLNQVSNTLGQRGDYEKMASGYIAKTLQIFEDLDLPQRDQVLRVIAQLRNELGKDSFAALWRKASGDKTQPNLPARNLDQALLDPLINLFEASTWTEAQNIIEANPDLLTIDVGAVRKLLVTVLSDEMSSKKLQYLKLLERCRAIGIKATFAALQMDYQSLTQFLNLGQQDVILNSNKYIPATRWAGADRHFMFRCAYCGNTTEIIVVFPRSGFKSERQKETLITRYCEHCSRLNLSASLKQGI